MIWSVARALPAEAAATSRFPDADSVSSAAGNSDAYASVAESGNYTDSFGNVWSIGRDTPIDEFKIFYKLNGPGATAAATFQIKLLHACDFSEGLYTRGNGDMRVTINAIDTATGDFMGALDQKDNNVPANCNGVDMDFTVNRSDVVLVPSRYGSEYGVIGIRTTKLPGVGANSFQVFSADGQGVITFNEQLPAAVATNANPGSNTSFAIWDNPNWPSAREYNFEFKPDCQYIATYPDVNLRWFDADMDQIDPSISFTIEIINDSDSSVAYTQTIDRNSTPNIGDTGPPSYRYLTVPVATPGQHYRWTWRNVTGLNGLQLWMPFSEMNQFITCPPPPGIVSCSVSIVTPPPINPGSNFTVQFTVTNNSASSISSASGYAMGAKHASLGSGTSNYMAPDAANWVKEGIDWGPGAIAASGGIRTWITTFTARAPSLTGTVHSGAGPYAANLAASNYDFQWKIIENDTNWVTDMCDEDLTVNGPANVVSCNVVVNPVVPSVNQPIRITGTLNNNNPPAGATLTNADYEMTLSATNGVLANTNVDFDGDVGTPGNDPVPPGGAGVGYVDDNAPGGVGTFRARVVLTPLGGGPSVTCEEDYQVAGKPYVKFFGADVNAGGRFNTAGGQCAVAGAVGGPGGTTIKTFARNDNPINTYHGSSVEFAAFSLTGIIGDTANTQNDDERGFYSASLRGRGTEGLYLTYSNVNGIAMPPFWQGNYWGGDFGAPTYGTRCIEDYYNTTRIGTPVNKPANTLQLHASGGGGGLLDSGQYQATGPVVLTNNAAQPFNGRVTLYVDGDIFINDSIYYNTNFSTGVPYLSIIASGDIYIRNSVTNIDALLIAQPRDASGTVGGKVYTCAKPNGASFEKFTAAEIPGNCGQQLVIHGSVIAQQVRFLRTLGSVNNAPAPEPSSTGTAAEVINMTPEFYIGVPLFRPRSGSNTGAQTYHAIQTLPPVF